MASMQGWWVRETYIRAIELLAPPALAGLATGALYRGVTAPISRIRFLYAYKKLTGLTTRNARLRFIFTNRAPATWPLSAIKIRPTSGTFVPFSFVSAISYAAYVGGTRVWRKEGDEAPMRFLKSAVVGAAASQLTRPLFRSHIFYRATFPAPYFAIAFPAYDELRGKYSIVPSALIASFAGSVADAIFSRVWLSTVHTVQSTIVLDPKPSLRFKSKQEILLWGLMHSSRIVPRAIILSCLEFFLTLFAPFKDRARVYLETPTNKRIYVPTAPTTSPEAVAVVVAAAAAAATTTESAASEPASAAPSPAQTPTTNTLAATSPSRIADTLPSLQIPVRTS